MSGMGGIEWKAVPVSENLRVIAMNQAISFTTMCEGVSIESVCEIAENIHKFLIGK